MHRPSPCSASLWNWLLVSDRETFLLSISKTKYGAAVIVTLVALRFLIGFHFFSEGAMKVRNGKPFSGAFFANAKGPLAPTYRDLVWDPDGLARLNYAVNEDGSPGLSTERTQLAWEAHVDNAAAFYRFDDNQKVEARRVGETWVELLNEFAKDYRPELLEYFHGVRRRDRNRVDPAMNGVESLRGQKKKWESKLKTAGAPLIATAEALRSGYEMAIFNVANEEQRKRGIFEVPQPGRRAFDSVTMDSFIPYFDMAIGLLLMFGLFTRTASVIGAVFLGSVVLSQFPGATEAVATWPQAIEMVALIALAATTAGRFAGLDLFTAPLCQRLLAGKKKTGSNA